MKPLRKYLAEFIGTFCLVFAGTGAIIVNQITGGQVTNLGVGLTFGLIVLAMIYAIGHISGAHLNPAVTLGFYSSGRMSLKEVPRYIISQCVGAILASALLRLLFIGEETGMGVTSPSGSVTQSFILEFVLTFILMFVIMGVATGDREEGIMAGVAIGATIALEAIFGGPISGASMNPARSLAPALVSGNFSHQWIYWVGPILGSVLGGLTYRFVQCSP
jgi:aquaporin Z